MSDGSGSIATLGSIRGMPNLLDDVERMPERPSVPSLIALLRSTDETERDDALASLAELVDGAFGVDGAELGLAVRANGGIALLSWLLADPSAEVQQMALMILGNLCSDSVDSNSRATKALLLQSLQTLRQRPARRRRHQWQQQAAARPRQRQRLRLSRLQQAQRLRCALRVAPCACPSCCSVRQPLHSSQCAAAAQRALCS